MGIFRAGVLLVLSTLGAFAVAEGVPLPTLEPVTPVVEGLPRGVITFVARVHNPSDARQQMGTQIALPSEWQVLIPPEPMTLDPGTSQVMNFSVLVAANAKAGSYTFPVGIYLEGQPGRTEALFTVTVRDVRQLEIDVLEAPAMVVAEPYQARFHVRNAGNVAEDVYVSVVDNRDFQVALEPSSLRLAPGEAYEVRVSVEPPRDVRERLVHDLQLFAHAAEDPGVQASARVRIEIIPRQLNGFAAYHSFPLTVRFTGGLAANLSLSDLGAAPSSVGVEITGSGRLWENDPGRFTVHLSGTSDLRQHRLFARYAHPDFLVAAGDQSYGFSPLVEGGSGLGIRASAQTHVTEGVDVGASVAAYDATGGPGLGAAVSVELTEDVEISAHFLRTPEASTASARFRLHSAPLPTLVPHTLHLDAEYAVASTHDADLHGAAFRVVGGVRTEGGTMQAGYTWKDAAFDGSDLHRSTVEFSTRLQLNDALRVDHAPVVLSLAYRNASEFASSDSTEGARHGGLGRDTTYSAALSGQVGGVSLLGQYRRRAEEDASTGDAEHESALQASAGVSLGGGAALQQSLTWKRAASNLQPEAQNEIGYDAQARTHLGDTGTLEATFGVTYVLEQHELTQLDLGVSWTGHLTSQLRSTVSGEFHLMGSEMIQISGSGTYQLGAGRALDVALWAKAYRDRSPDLRLGVAYSFPVDLRLGRLASIGAVTGIVADEEGQGLPDITLQLAGSTVASGADGRFHFPAIPAGEHYLTIRPEALGPDQLITPALPYRVDLASGGEVAIELRVVQAAEIQGAVRLHDPEHSLHTSDAQEQVRPRSSSIDVRGVLIELSNGEVTHRTLTSVAGSFEFPGLLPGRWELRVHRGDWPEEYRLERTEYVVELAAGGGASVDVALEFVPRTIRFIDGGSVGGSEEVPVAPAQP